MVGPYGIEQVDVGRALQMYGAGRQMRAAEMEAERKRKAEEKAAEVQGRLAAVYARAFQPKGGDPASSGGSQASPVKPVAPGNLPLGIRYRVPNSDGSVSTVRTISIGVDGGEVLIPTVINGRVVSEDEAIRHYERTGENFGMFRSPDEATTYAKWLHNRHAGQMGGQGLVATPEQEAESARMEAMFPETRGMTPPDAFQNPLMRPEVRQQLIGEIATIDPTEVPKLIDMFGKLDDQQLKRAQDVYKMGGAVTLEIRNTPPAQRAALIQKRIEQFGPMIPQFAEILQRTDPNDNAAWEALFNQARDIEKVAAAGLPETRVLPEGATIYEQAPTSPFRSFGQATPQIPPEAIADLRANPGTAAQFDQIFGPGAAQSVLGGRQAMSAGGNTMTQSQYRAVQQSMGTSAAARWLAANKIRVVAD